MHYRKFAICDVSKDTSIDYHLPGNVIPKDQNRFMSRYVSDYKGWHFNHFARFRNLCSLFPTFILSGVRRAVQWAYECSSKAILSTLTHLLTPFKNVFWFFAQGPVHYRPLLSEYWFSPIRSDPRICRDLLPLCEKFSYRVLSTTDRFCGRFWNTQIQNCDRPFSKCHPLS